MVMTEVKMSSVDKTWDSGTLFSQKGWFYMSHVFSLLDPFGEGKYKLAFKQIQRLVEKNQDPFDVMGRRKRGGRVIVLMERFAPWYLANPIFRTRRLDASLPFSTFLKQKDCFYRLSEVCRYYQEFLPYSYAILKRGADKHEDPLQAVGIVKSDTTYLVALPRFEEWLRLELLG